MKKNKIITISLLGLLLLVPFITFITPTRAQPPSYVGVADTDSYLWGYDQYDANWVQFTADNMEEAFVAIFSHDPESNLTKLYWDWEWTWWTNEADSNWDLTVDALLPENSTILLSSYFIFDNITHTPYNVSLGYIAPQWPAVTLQWTDEYEIVSNTSSFAKASLYGAMATTPYWLQGIPIGPNNINWTEFVIEAQLGLENYWGGWAGNTTMTALANGYEMYVPALGYENNTLPITITTTYDSDGVLIYNSMEYGSNLLYRYLRSDAPTPVVTVSPIDLILPDTYTGESISWTATDLNPENYTITLDGAPLIGSTAWTSGGAVVYNIPDGLTPGLSYTYEIIFKNIYGNSISDSVEMIVGAPDTTDPVITMAQSDLTVEFGSLGSMLSWTATDVNPATYTITLNGTDIVVDPTPWVSGTPVTYYIPSSLNYLLGVSTYEITFSDINGNNVSDSATITVNPKVTALPAPPGIPGFDPLIVIGITSIAVISLIAFKKKRK